MRERLDLMNSRLPVPRSALVYDSLETRSLASFDPNRGHAASARIANVPSAGRCHSKRALSSALPARFEHAKLDRRGCVVEIKDRHTHRHTRTRTPSSSSSPLRESVCEAVSPSRSLSPLSSAHRERASSSSADIRFFDITADHSEYNNNDNNNNNNNNNARSSSQSYTIDGLSPVKPRSSVGDAHNNYNNNNNNNNNRSRTASTDSLASPSFIRSLSLSQAQTEREAQTFSSPMLDRIRDRIHDSDAHTILARIESKKLPGATWSSVKKDSSKLFAQGCTSPVVGPGSYEVYDSQSSAKNVIFSTKKHSSIDSESDADAEPILPRKERMRRERQTRVVASCWPAIVAAEKQRDDLLLTSNSDCRLVTERLHLADVKFAPSRKDSPTKPDRFRAPEYRQESFVKTSGMLLSPDFDKSFDKRIPFKFETSSSASNAFQGNDTTAEVDVDTGKFFSITEEIKRSPVRYAAAFRSRAEKAVPTPQTTSAPHIGPGSFADAFPPACSVHRPHEHSLAFRTARYWPVRDPAPDSLLSPRPFAETNRRGITFPRERTGVDARNLHLETIVREKMGQIYPKLAEQKFAAQSPSAAETKKQRTRRIK